MKKDDNVNKFLKGLDKLANKYGLSIGGCGCCGSPFVYQVEKLKAGFHKISEDCENLDYVEKES